MAADARANVRRPVATNVRKPAAEDVRSPVVVDVRRPVAVDVRSPVAVDARRPAGVAAVPAVAPAVAADVGVGVPAAADGDAVAEAILVAIDGPSGVGKSTAARRLAERLGVPVLDTGAMYRAIGLRALEEGVDLGDEAAVVRLAESIALDLRPVPGGGPGDLELWIDEAPAGERIRTHAVSDATSRVSVHPALRRRMVALQRAWGARHGAVVEGRDIGTVVFPDTPHKFFLDARAEVRARRRCDELLAKGEDVDYAEILADVERRDARDSARADSPLTCDETYERIDTSEAAPDEVVARMEASVTKVTEDGTTRRKPARRRPGQPRGPAESRRARR